MKIILLKWILPIVMYTVGSILLLGLPFWTGLTIALLYGFGTSFYWTGVILEWRDQVMEEVERIEKEELL